MGLLDDLFSFKTPAQQQKEQAAFEARMFPLGEGQRRAAAALLAALLPNPRMKNDERMFLFLAAKDQYLNEENPAEGLARAKRQLAKGKRLPPAQQQLLLALVRLDAAAPALEGYPTEERVRAAANAHSSEQ